MNAQLPSQCPECGSIQGLSVTKVPPWEHERSEQWETKAVCEHCGQFETWGRS